jgi:hypothetical protein
MSSVETQKSYRCEICDYNTSRFSQYTRHITTRKHLMLTKKFQKVPHDSIVLECECGRRFAHRQSLHRHKNTCERVRGEVSTGSYAAQHNDTGLIIELLKQNKELKELLCEQNKQIIEIASKPSSINHTTNNNNQKFNLNFFLNTTCKDAINLSEFIETIEVQMSELENIGHNGYVAGMTDIILSRIKDLDVSKRPVHCTDLKREIMYIKDQNEWNKDTAEKSYLRKAIAMVAKKNYGKTIEWRNSNPECLEVGSPKYDFCFKMMRNVLGDFEDVQFKLDNKIIKSLAKEVVVDR